VDAILTFHDIGPGTSPLCFPAAGLGELLGTLTEEGVRFVTLGGLLEPTEAACHRVAITFDDGLRSVHAEALPLLSARRIPATVFVVSRWVGRDNAWPTQVAGTPPLPLMGWSELEELRSEGVEIGSHGTDHRPLPGLTDAELREELQDSHRELEDRLGTRVEHFAYPYGAHDDDCVEAARTAYRSAVTTRMAYASPEADPLRLPRLDAYYLRSRAHRALFDRRSRAYLAARAMLRRVRRGGAD